MNLVQEVFDLYNKNEHLVGKLEFKVFKTRKGEERIPQVLLPIFYSTAAAQVTVTIDEEGNFLKALPVPPSDKLTMIPVTEKSGSRTASIEPHPFCDNIKYLAGDYGTFSSPGSKDFSANYRLYIEALGSWHRSPYSHKKVDTLYAYLQKGTLISDLVSSDVIKLDEQGKMLEKEKIQNVDQTDAFVRFVIRETYDSEADILRNEDGGYSSECWQDRTLQDAYISYYRSILQEKDLCYLTGEYVPVTYLQPKKIRNEGDGAKLISSNDETNFTFRGRFNDKKQAFAIGYEASQKFHNALKWIIRKQGSYWDGFCIVVWESNLKKIPELSADTDDIYSEWEEEEQYQGTGEGKASRFRAALQGYGKKLDEMSKVVILAFDAATTGRLSMLEQNQLETSRYLANIQHWHESCKWQQVKYKDSHLYRYEGMAGIRDIAEVLYGTEQNGVLTVANKKIYGEVYRRIYSCISDRRRIPVDMVRLAVQRASLPIIYEKRYNWERILSVACSFVKKERQERKKEVWNLALNETSKDRSYLYGRLLAVADRIERRTFDREEDEKRATNADRYMNVFSQRPYETWQIIEKRIQPYYLKLDIQERNTYKKLLDQIYELFDEESFADNRKLEGLYLLGYHSQSYVLKYGNKKEEKEETHE